MAALTEVDGDGFRRQLIQLQSFTLAWMLAECGLSLLAAVQARSAVLLAFGSDSLVELLSALLVLLSVSRRLGLVQPTIDRAAGGLLYLLAALVAATAARQLYWHRNPEPSPLGIAVALAALCVMPWLAWRKRALARAMQNTALSADAAQSAACAYLAVITLVGLALNSAFHLGWVDPVAALLAVPLLLREAYRTWRGHGCQCH